MDVSRLWSLTALEPKVSAAVEWPSNAPPPVLVTLVVRRDASAGGGSKSVHVVPRHVSCAKKLPLQFQVQCTGAFLAAAALHTASDAVGPLWLRVSIGRLNEAIGMASSLARSNTEEASISDDAASARHRVGVLVQIDTAALCDRRGNANRVILQLDVEVASDAEGPFLTMATLQSPVFTLTCLD